MRLIDADALRWAIRENAPKSVPLWVYQTIDKQPTAYDADRVVRQLKTDSSVKLYGSGNSNNYLILLEKAIEIIKGGGKDE